MADAITIQELIDARTDAKTLEEAVNGDAVTTVLSRLGETYPTLSNALSQIDGKLDSADAQIKLGIISLFENGGLPATPFATKALMTASALVDGDYAMVTDDTVADDNGLYKKTDGVWAKSSYDPVAQAKEVATAKADAAINYTKESFIKIADDIDLDSIESERFFPTNNGTWLSSDAGYTGKFIAVNTGDSYAIIGHANQETMAYIAPDKPAPNSAVVASDIISIPAGSTKSVIIPSDFKYLWVSALTNAVSSLPQSIKKMLAKPIYHLNTTDDVLAGDSSALVTVKAASKINNNVESINSFIEPLRAYDPQYNLIPAYIYEGSGFTISSPLILRGDNPNVKSFGVDLATGDVLSFNYIEYIGNILTIDEGDVGTGLTLLCSTTSNGATKSHSFTAYRAMRVIITNAIASTVTVNDSKPNLIPYGVYSLLNTTINRTHELTSNKKVSGLFDVKKGDTVKITNPDKSAASVVVETENRQALIVVAQLEASSPDTEVVWSADRDSKIRLAGKLDSTFAIKKAINISNAIADKIGGSGSAGDLDVITLPELEYVFATHQNFVLKTEMVNGVEQIAISQDVGKTWTYTPNVIGDIVSYHFYSDGTIQLCSPTKVWWTSDYVTFNQSTVLDYDGSVFQPYTHHFFNQQNSDTTMFVGDTELYVWGEYVIDNPTPRIWYSTDLGRTVKCAFIFGADVDKGKMNGVRMYARHVHDIAQDKDTESFYLTTGDVGDENNFIKFEYKSTTDSFNWTVLGTGPSFKIGKIFFDKAYLYFITDYTTDTGLQDKNGIYRVGKNHVTDSSKYRPIYIVNAEEWGTIAPFRMVMDRHGNKVLLVDYLGLGVIWLATEGMDFKKIALSKHEILSYVIGPNYSGDVYCVTNSSQNDLIDNTKLKLTGGTYNLTKALRQSGLSNFMTDNLLSNDLQHN